MAFLLILLLLSSIVHTDRTYALETGVVITGNPVYITDGINAINYNGTSSIIKKKLSLKERIIIKLVKSKLLTILHKGKKSNKNITGILSFSLSLLAIGFIVTVYFSSQAIILLGIAAAAALAAVVLGVISNIKKKKKNWMAILGIILGIVALTVLAYIALLTLLLLIIVDSLFGWV
jgi:ethanolamine utilization microcompartment shell protein EutS